jgi:DNA helicase-2/ATP-dependent DNA helicase PcrA
VTHAPLTPADASLDERSARILHGLDHDQYQAVTAPVGVVVVRAGAGAGKTRVLTHRLAWRALQDPAVLPHSLAITFTREAAGELRRRLRQFDFSEMPTAGTFHAIAYRLLRQRYADTRRREPTVLLNRMQLLSIAAGENVHGGALSEISNTIDIAYAKDLTTQQMVDHLQHRGNGISVPPAQYATIVEEYEKLKKKRGVLDLNDMLRLTIHEALDDGRFLSSIRWQYRHILVDEAQDMNPLQYRFLRLVAGDTPDLFVVGDPNQAIYGWNGADHTLFDQLPDLPSPSQVVTLPSNYRCTPPIVEAAVHMLSNVDTNVAISRRPVGGPVELVRCETEHDELDAIEQHLRDMHDRLPSWRHLAVLVRTNNLAQSISDELSRRGIPTQRLMKGHSYSDAVNEASALGGRDLLNAWASDILDLPDVDTPDATIQVAQKVREYLTDNPVGHVDGRSFASWLATSVSLEMPDGVAVMNFHAAKGREWYGVIIAGAEKGLLPHVNARTTLAREEEQRLAYVAMTRASDVLVITWTDSRNGRRTGPSGLLRDIPTGKRDVVAPPQELRAIASKRQEDNRVRDALEQWRANAARAARVDVHAIVSDKQLKQLSAESPQDVEHVARIVGSIFASRHGQRIVDVIKTALAPQS